MTRVVIDKKGLVSYGPPDDPTSLEITHLKNEKNSVIVADSTGVVSASTLAANARYEYYLHSGSAQIASGTTNFVQVQVNGAGDQVNGGLSLWNTSMHRLQPEAIGDIYTIRFTGQIAPASGNPVFHLDFHLSGTTPGEAITRHHQSHEQTVRTNADHVHIQAIYVVFCDEDLYVSGGMLSMTSEGAALNLLSASILIKEG